MKITVGEIGEIMQNRGDNAELCCNETLCIDVTMLAECIQGVKQYYFSFTSDMNLC